MINRHCSKVVWVKAEIVKLNYYRHSGHCYPDLVEKKNGRIIAEIRGNIWKSQYEKINEKFRSVLKEDLKDDMTVVIQATVTYHSVYGLALNILDISPEYTLGELARQKAETISRLKKENLFDANRQVSLPTLPKTIAIISVSTSKGFQDFISVINNNEWGYRYHHKLFPAILQGERAVPTIVQQLTKVRQNADIFDAVAIIRGGGGEIGLSCYDDYRLARTIAEFPIPVLTGIGHSTNETVSELVSYRSFITPTKIAEFLLQEFHDFANPLRENTRKLRTLFDRTTERQKTNLRETVRLFSLVTGRILDRNESKLKQARNSILNCSKSRLHLEHTNLKSKASTIQLLSPENILKRGFSISRVNGKAVVDPDGLQAGDHLETEIYKGKINSRIETVILKSN